MSTDLVERVRGYIARENLMAPGERVLVAVSGGADSMVLLHVLRALHYDVRVAHFDHLTRAGESTEDAAFVSAYCRAIGVACEVGVWREQAGQTGSHEMRAREARYQFLVHAAMLHGCAVIATGHHADDQAETILFRMLRGTGPEGLAGILPKRKALSRFRGLKAYVTRTKDGCEHDAKIIRPLLLVDRGSVEAFARSMQVDWRTDITNLDGKHRRNWIRQILMPQIVSGLNPKAVVALGHLGDSLRHENDFLESATREAAAHVVEGGAVERESFRKLHVALQRRVLRKLILPREAANSFETVNAAVGFVCDAMPGHRLSLNGDYELFASKDRVYCMDMRSSQPESTMLDVPGSALFQGLRFFAKVSSCAPDIPLKEYCNKHRQCFDADALGSLVGIVAGGSGNEFHPLGAAHAKNLMDYLKNRQVPLPERLTIPVIHAATGVAWVVGHAPGTAYVVTPETKHFATIEVFPGALE